MPEQNYTQVSRALGGKDARPDSLSRVYLLTGSDDMLKHEILERLKLLALDPGFSDFDYSMIDLGPAGAESDNAADPVLKILSSAASAPFASPRRVVVATSIQKLSGERQSALAQGLATLGPLSLLILIADAPEVEAGRPKGRGIETSLKKSAASHGMVVACDMPQAADLKSRAEQIFEDWGLRAEPAVCNAVAEYASTVSGNAGSGAVAILTRECEKLRSYVGESSAVTMRDASALLPSVTQENIFKLLDYIGARNTAQALAQLDAILLAGDKPDGVAARTFVMLQRHVRMLILGKHVSGKRGRGDNESDLFSLEMTSTLGGSPYRLQSYIRQSANFTDEQLAWASMRILASDMTMKGMVVPENMGASPHVMSDEPVANLRMLITELCAGR